MTWQSLAPLAPFLVRMVLGSAAIGLLVPLALVMSTYASHCQQVATSRGALLIHYVTPRQSGLPAGACLLRTPGRAPERVDYAATGGPGAGMARFTDTLVAMPAAFAVGGVIVLLRLRRWLQARRRSE